jgi:hypothetical protein
LLGFPDHFFVQHLAPGFPQAIDDPSAVLQVLPKKLGVEQLEFRILIPEQLTQAPVVEEQTSLLVHDDQAGGAIFEQLPELPFRPRCGAPRGR